MLLSKRFVEPRVLLIEDAEETQELSRLALESQACQVTAVSSAEAA
ncbi:MAG: response regulator, partial [Stenotrophomonas sp.]|nr:response regulator [Stenotrophomonas sp.]